MAALKNTRRELFAQAVARGLCNCAAQQAANYKPDRGNAARLTANDSVAARIAELQQEAARSTKVTLESIISELNEAAAIAKERGQGQALVSVASLKAKLSGLLTEKIEVGPRGSFDGLTSTAAIADEVLAQLVEGFHPVDQADRAALVAMYQRHLQEAAELINSIKGRPITGERCDLRDLSRPWTEHRPFTPRSPMRIGYRSNGGVK
jgi:hypothetical protein